MIYLYSAFIECLWVVITATKRLLPIPASQLANRNFGKEEMEILRRLRAQKSKCILWFCSSAGEYEQAKPVIESLSKNDDIWQLIIFFSRSGYEFAKARGENNTFIMSPPDSIWRWRALLRAIYPSVSIVVRHELWPAFLHAAAEFGDLLLINAAAQDTKRCALSRTLRAKLLNKVDWIAAVDQESEQSLAKIYKGPTVVTGDTKYEQALARAAIKTNSATSTTPLEILAAAIGASNNQIVIGGSVWPDDVKIMLEAIKLIPNDQRSDWRLILAPHDISHRMLEEIENLCRAKSLTPIRLCNIASTTATTPDDIVLIDSVGFLAELYGLAKVGFVGGAMHHRIHNVLEPASHGLFLAHGPRYTNSTEAKNIVENKLSLVINTAEQLATWLKATLNGASHKNSALMAFMQANTGATRKISARIKESLEST